MLSNKKKLQKKSFWIKKFIPIAIGSIKIIEFLFPPTPIIETYLFPLFFNIASPSRSSQQDFEYFFCKKIK